LVGIILAHADLVETARGHRPLLLLDEVAAHLDPLRREALYDRVRPNGGQVWMTGTEAAPFAPLGADATRINLA
jgi:DNA replication and repair protein RecF